jgi:hypothetical protein
MTADRTPPPPLDHEAANAFFNIESEVEVIG